MVHTLAGMSVPAPPPARSRRRRTLVTAVTVMVVGVAFLGLLPALADYGEVWRAVQRASVAGLLFLVVAGVFSQVIGPLPTMVVIPTLRFGHALYSRFVATAAANALPGGGAVGVGLTYTMLGRWGHTGAEIGASVVLTGIWNNFARLLLPAIALLAAATAGASMPSLVDATLIGVASLAAGGLVLVLVVRSRLADRVLRPFDRLVAAIQRRRGRPVSLEDSPSRRFLATISAAIGTRWVLLMATTLAYHLSLYLCLEAALRAVGLPDGVSWVEVFAAFSLVRLVSTIPLTPGSLGITEVGLTGLLATGLDAAGSARVAAGVLLFRFVTYAVPTVAGAAAALAWRRAVRRGSAVDPR